MLWGFTSLHQAVCHSKRSGMCDATGGEGRGYTKQQKGYMVPVAQGYTGATLPGRSTSGNWETSWYDLDRRTSCIFVKSSSTSQVMKDISQDLFWKGLERVGWGGSCELPRLRWAVSTAFHPGPMEMEETADSVESAPSPRGHLSMRVLETWDSTETALSCEVPAPGTGRDTATAKLRSEPDFPLFL